MCCVTVYDYLYDQNITIDEITWLITEFDRAGLVTQDLVTKLKMSLPLLFSYGFGSTTREEYYKNEYTEFSKIFQENFRKYFPLLFRSYGYRVTLVYIPKLLKSALRLELNGQN